MSVGPLASMLSRRRVMEVAGPRFFERGELYAQQRRVKRLSVSDHSATAVVQGTDRYRVELTLSDDGELTWTCSCPVGVDGGFCKHRVAVALVVRGEQADESVDEEAAVDVVAYLRSLDHERLVELVCELAANDELLDARLRLDAVRTATGITSPPLRAFRDAIDTAFVTGDYVDYRNAYDYSQNIDRVLDSLQALLDDGHPEAVIELCEHALVRLEDAVGYVDDSDGWLGSVADRIGDLHLASCTQARPDPVALAERIFAAELNAETFDVFHGAAVTYAEVLGADGLAAYRRLAEDTWARQPQLGPGDDRHAWRNNRFRITGIMETLASMTGDVDAEVAVLARDLSSAWQYVRIVEAYRRADRRPDALDWAEQGLAAFGSSDSRLVEVLADEYYAAGRGDDAVRLVWEAFDERPTLVAYERLRRHARQANAWDDWHVAALDRLRPDPTERGCASELVRVLLDEGDTDAAWAEANRAGVNARLWLELAAAREVDHPADAIPVYQDDVEVTIAAKNNNAYRAAVQQLDHIATLMAAAGQPEAFTPYVAEVRARHKPKWNLMKLLDERGW